MAEETLEAAPAAAPVEAPTAAPAAPSTASPAPAPTTAATNTAEPSEPKAGYWPADWRQTVSKADAKVLSRLERYASPEAAMQALIEAQNRISKGELKPVLGKSATPEQVAEWRSAHGIPEAPDKYSFDKDVKVDHIDKEVLGTVLKAAHESNQTPDQVQATMKAWNQIEQMAAEKRAEADLKVQKEAEDSLRAEWGGEYRRNINLIHGLLDGSASPDLKESLLNGRLADGTPIGSSPAALKMLASLALIQNPAGVVVPGSEGNLMQGVEDELGKIEKMMRENRHAYNKDEKVQARYRELLEAREKLKTK